MLTSMCWCVVFLILVGGGAAGASPGSIGHKVGGIMAGMPAHHRESCLTIWQVFKCYELLVIFN